MAKIGDVLREAHRLRRHTRELQAEIDRGPRLLKAQQARFAREEEAHRTAQDELKRLKVSVHEKETTLKATYQSIARYEQQQASAANQKEYDARQTDIATARARCAQLEDEILSAMTEIEERTARIPALDQQLATARQEHAAFEKQAAARYEHLKAELARSEGELQALEAGIPAEVRRNYDRLVKSYGADAFAAVKDRVCQHCRMTVTGAVQNLVEAGDFATCASCFRALYLPG